MTKIDMTKIVKFFEVEKEIMKKCKQEIELRYRRVRG
jgi:hypothetical protein